MANRATRRRNRSRKVMVGGLTIAAMLAATRPLLPTHVYAAGMTYDWVRQNEYIDTNGGWYGTVARSADDRVLMSAIVDGDDDNEESPLYISRDNGESWENIAEDIDNNITHSWNAVDVSDDGEVLVAASNYGWDYDLDDDVFGRVFVSEDGGDTWANITPEDEGDEISNWQHAVVSGNGQRIVAVSSEDTDNVYVTDNAGDTWQALPVDGDWSMNNWDTLAVSDDGSKILFGGESWETATTQLYLSDDDGAVWDNITPEIGVWEYEVHAAMDATGDQIVASIYGEDGGDVVGKVFMSESEGAEWTDVTPDPEEVYGWNAVALSDDGSVVAAANSSSDNLYFANTADMEWDSVHPGEAFDDSDINWFSIDLNADGSGFIGSGGEEVYTTAIDSSEDATVVDFSNAENSKTVVLTLPSGTTVTCQSAVKESGLSAQDAGYQYPVGLVDFCFTTEDESNEISLLFVTDLKPDQVVARKYNPDTQQYATVSGVSIVETTYNSQHALLVTYTIVDNGPLDLDADDGEIADPVGLGTVLGVPSTGLQSVRDFLFGRH